MRRPTILAVSLLVAWGCRHVSPLDAPYEQPVLAGGLDDAGTRHIFNTDQAGNVLASGTNGLAVGATTPFQPTLIGGLDDAGTRHIFNTDQAGNLVVSGGGGGGGSSTPPYGTDGGFSLFAGQCISFLDGSKVCSDADGGIVVTSDGGIQFNGAQVFVNGDAGITGNLHVTGSIYVGP